MPFARRGPLRLHWEIGGDERGHTIFLIRGLSRSSRYWYDVRPLLETRFRVLVMDNRGVGRSDAPPPYFSTADMADDCAAVLDQSATRIPAARISCVHRSISRATSPSVSPGVRRITR